MGKKRNADRITTCDTETLVEVTFRISAVCDACGTELEACARGFRYAVSADLDHIKLWLRSDIAFENLHDLFDVHLPSLNDLKARDARNRKFDRRGR